MTIIAAVTDGLNTYIGADWACTYESTDVVFYDRTPKVREFSIQNNPTPALLGMAGDSSIPSRLQGMILPPLPDGGEPDIYWAEAVGRLVTATIMDSPNPPMMQYDGENEGINGEFLLVVGHRIFVLLEHGAVEPDRPYVAIGAGADFAQGYLYAMHVFRKLGPMPSLLDSCIRATCASVSSCGLDDREPFVQLAPGIVRPVAAA